MKIGIYSKWIESLGGGEKVATTMAETLSRAGHQVEIISLVGVDKGSLEKKMGVNLSRVDLSVWPDRRSEILTKNTKKYDLFINTSFLDHLPSRAKKSIYYIHFPTPIRRTLFGFIKYETILPFLRKFLVIPTITKGMERVEEVLPGRSGRWLHRKNSLVIANAPKKFRIALRFYIERFDFSVIDPINIFSPDSQIKLIDKNIDHKVNVINYVLEITLTKKSVPVLEINLKSESEVRNIALVSLTIDNIRFVFWNILKKVFPAYEMALYGSATFRPAAGLFTYDLLLANSNFSAEWTKRYWGEEAKVLYPPVDIENFKPGKKKKMILNVGRFFVGGHSKKQHILVHAFKEMIDKRFLSRDWELHLVGRVAPGGEHIKYFETVQEMAKGYPVFIHLAADFSELKNLYAQATIYWHATGFGESPHEPIMFEHFGISPVEAMAAGAVPVVYGGGGVIESVGEESGLTWKTQEELIRITRSLINDKQRLSTLSEIMRNKAKRFSLRNFSTGFLKYVSEIFS